MTLNVKYSAWLSAHSHHHYYYCCCCCCCCFPDFLTSCARGDKICLRPLQVDTIFAFIRQVTVLFWHNNIFVFILQLAPIAACWLLQQVDLWPFDLESGVRATCDMGYLYANFSLPRPLCSRVKADVRDSQTDVRRQTDVRQKHRLMSPPY